MVMKRTKPAASKPAKKKAQSKDRPDLEEGYKTASSVIKENIDWLKDMAKK